MFYMPVIKSASYALLGPVLNVGFGGALELIRSYASRPVDAEGYPLHDAAVSREPRVIEELVQKGARVNLQNALGETPLIQASKRGNAANVACLLRLGANIEMRDNTNESAVVHAVRSKNLATVQALVLHGASLFVQSANQESLLRMDTTEVIRQYLRAQPGINLIGDSAEDRAYRSVACASASGSRDYDGPRGGSCNFKNSNQASCASSVQRGYEQRASSFSAAGAAAAASVAEDEVPLVPVRPGVAGQTDLERALALSLVERESPAACAERRQLEQALARSLEEYNQRGDK